MNERTPGATEQHDLVDECRLMVFPVVLRRGKRLFDNGSDSAPLGLVQAKLAGEGVLILTYQRDGK